jgi:peroxiredoxin
MRPGEDNGGAGAGPDIERKSSGPVMLLLVLVAVSLTVAACLGGPPVMADGEAAHAFSLPALPGYAVPEVATVPGSPALAGSGTRIALSDYAGEPVIINFFAAWSPPCKAETKLLATFYRLYNRYDGKVLVIGVDSRDSRAAALRLLRASGVTYPVASDPALAVSGKYGVPGLPTTYFLNAQHQIVKTNLGWLNWHKLREGVAAMDAT